MARGPSIGSASATGCAGYGRSFAGVMVAPSPTSGGRCGSAWRPGSGSPRPPPCRTSPTSTSSRSRPARRWRRPPTSPRIPTSSTPRRITPTAWTDSPTTRSCRAVAPGARPSRICGDSTGFARPRPGRSVGAKASSSRSSIRGSTTCTPTSRTTSTCIRVRIWTAMGASTPRTGTASMTMATGSSTT